ncbi:reverse transcriptase domain-containing protein [Clostridium estertheticum]|uniref:reverse transcriptase domain-containing protein n=1 Tax=Clostridium estertheticum TaxID=238834 RepID=UPI001C0C9618|nr:reverse transcriptase domain-containing protein [Clostridium estertheticum]MBU3174298.1 reverse transcriptase family protein [Clostridium estertheticum]
MNSNNNSNNNNNMYLFKSLNIPIFNDLTTFCDEIGISTKLIFLILNDSKKFYETFNLKKKNGEIREINSPKFSLKLIQKWILKHILERIKVSDESMAFRIDKLGGIKTNADKHKYSLYILEMDMKDFFNSITEKRVFFIFKSIGYNNDAAKILTKICTYDGYLPQGGVCSPYLSNLVCIKLDKRITGLCSNRDIIYSRYADDCVPRKRGKQLVRVA